jgi:4-diphosphocytidyl-2-C-methyl-D-erythritol kinase
VRLTETAPAKVNLTLRVTGRRADGYHLLDSLVVFGPAADLVHAEPAGELSLALSGPFAAGLRAEPDNLVLRTARALAGWAQSRLGAAPALEQHRPLGAALVLEKHLPVASGIGGGSADAAATLRLLARLWDLAVPAADMARLAAGLGADVPVCLATRPARMRGIGEILTAAPRLPSCGLLLVNPGVALATADVFRARSGEFSDAADLPVAWSSPAAMARDLAEQPNDLEPPALALCPAVGAVLEAVRAQPGCLLARMSGSGATCFGLFADAAAATRAGAGLPVSWWRSAGALG